MHRRWIAANSSVCVWSISARKNKHKKDKQQKKALQKKRKTMNKSWAYKWHGASANANVMQSETETKRQQRQQQQRAHTLSLCLFKQFYRALHHLFSSFGFLSLDKQKKNEPSRSRLLHSRALLSDNNLWVCRCFMVRCMSVCAGALLLAREHFKIIRTHICARSLFM